MERDSKEERRCFIEVIIGKILGKGKELNRMEERRGETERWIMITEMRRIEENQEILSKRGEISMNWGIGVDEDLTMRRER